MERSITTTVELDGTGKIVVIKRPDTEQAIEDIRHEARVLETARHPGVVDLVAPVDPRGRAAVVTRWVGPHTLAAFGSLSLDHIAGIIASLADSVADLHEIGVVHGAIAADHVILSPDGRPVLCGFGQARLVATSEEAAQAAADDDVAALGRVLRTMAGDDVELEPIPDRRGWRRRPRWQGYQRRALLTLADQATNDERQLRPTARSLAASIHDTIPEARVGPVGTPPEIPRGVLKGSDTRPSDATSAATSPDQITDDSPPQPGRTSVTIGPLPNQGPTTPAPATSRSRRAVLMVAALAGIVLVLFGLNEVRGQRARTEATAPRPSRRQPSVTASTTTTGRRRAAAPTRQTPTTSRRALPAHPCASVPGGLDLDADRCPDPVRVTTSFVEVKGTRFAVGRTGDRVVVGDWRCDGRATPALLRPTTGEVFVFPRWAARGRDITVRPTSRVAGAISIEAADSDGDGCRELRVRTIDDRVVVVPVEAAP